MIPSEELSAREAIVLYTEMPVREHVAHATSFCMEQL